MLSATSPEYWEQCLRDAGEAYNQYVGATAMEKLEIEVIPRAVEKKWSRVASTMATMLMDSLPEPLVRTEIVAKRRFAASEIL